MSQYQHAVVSEVAWPGKFIISTRNNKDIPSRQRSIFAGVMPLSSRTGNGRCCQTLLLHPPYCQMVAPTESSPNRSTDLERVLGLEGYAEVLRQKPKSAIIGSGS